MTPNPSAFPAPVRRVAIAGAGIGGLALGAALRQAGIEFTVYERAAKLHPVGAGLTMQANAMAALRTLDLDEAVASAGAVLGEAVILDRTGRLLQAIDLGRLGRELGAPVVGIHRARLHRILLDACGADGVRTDREVIGCEDEGERIRLRFRDGSAEEADLLVGADGLRSAVRAGLLGESPLRYSGYTSWRGICRAMDPAPVARTSESWGEGARFGIVPVGSGELYWFATANAPAGGEDPPGRIRESLLERFAGWHEPIARILERTVEEEIVRTDIHDRPPVRRWSKGRVVLLGDAAHPMTPNLGQGGCQAIEDAVVLARALRSFSTLAEALRWYENARVRRANQIVRNSRSAGRIAQWESPAAVLLRNALVRAVPRSIAARPFARAMRFEIPRL